MRLLYLADIRFPLERANGIQTFETCYGLAARGHDVDLLVRPDTATTVRDPFEFYGLEPTDRMRIRRVAVTGAPDVRRVLYLTQALTAVLGAARTVDITMTRDLGAASAILRLPPALRTPLVYESHGYAPVVSATMPELVAAGRVGSARKQRRLELRERRVWRRAEGYVTISQGLADDLVDRLGPHHHLRTVSDGVRLDPGRPFSDRPPAPRPVVAYAGHFHPWKGVDVLIDALARLPEVRALIIGGHPADADATRIERRAGERGVRDRITFTGMVPRCRVTELLSGADVLVIPHRSTPVSERYASPLKLFEYLAIGRPIVATDLSSLREVLTDGETARLCPPDDSVGLAAAIRETLTDWPSAIATARCAFDLAVGHTWERRAERLETLFEDVVGAS